MFYPTSLPDQYSPAPNILSGKKIVLTGGATDLGHAVAICCAQHGAELIFIERKERSVNALYDQIVGIGAPEPLTVAFDITQAETYHLNRLNDSLATEFDAIDGVIHLTTSAAPLTPLALCKPDIWQSFYQTAVLQPLALTSALLPLLQKAETPSVIFSSLSAGQTGRAYWGPVGAAFSAGRNVCETFSAEHDEIRFNTLAPGKVATAVRHKYYPAEAKSTLRACNDPLLLNHFLYLLDPETTLSAQHLRVPDIDQSS